VNTRVQADVDASEGSKKTKRQRFDSRLDIAWPDNDRISMEALVEAVATAMIIDGYLRKPTAA
jgi:hypothetical protein